MEDGFANAIEDHSPADELELPLRDGESLLDLIVQHSTDVYGTRRTALGM